MSCSLEWFEITIFSKYFTEERRKKREHILLGDMRINKEWLKDQVEECTLSR